MDDMVTILECPVCVMSHAQLVMLRLNVPSGYLHRNGDAGDPT